MTESPHRRRALDLVKQGRRNGTGQTLKSHRERSNPAGREARVIPYLREEWEQKYRVTNIEQAMEALGQRFDSALRMRIGARLKRLWVEDATFSKRLAKWGPDTFLLTNDEKLVAKYILLAGAGRERLPSRSETARTLGMEESRVARGWRALEQMAFLDKAGSGGGQLAADHARFLGGLGLAFHAVRLSGGSAFNVQCAADALLLAICVYPDQEVTIEDCCHHCASRLRIRMRGRKILAQSPRGIRLYEGAG